MEKTRKELSHLILVRQTLKMFLNGYVLSSFLVFHQLLEFQNWALEMSLWWKRFFHCRGQGRHCPLCGLLSAGGIQQCIGLSALTVRYSSVSLTL